MWKTFNYLSGKFTQGTQRLNIIRVKPYIMFGGIPPALSAVEISRFNSSRTFSFSSLLKSFLSLSSRALMVECGVLFISATILQACSNHSLIFSSFCRSIGRTVSKWTGRCAIITTQRFTISKLAAHCDYLWYFVASSECFFLQKNPCQTTQYNKQ